MADKTQILSGVWSNPAIWSPAGVPAIGQSVESPGAFDLAVEADTLVIASFDKQFGVGTLTVDATKTLETTNEVNLYHPAGTYGTGTIVCGGSLYLGSGHTFTGNISIEMAGTGNYRNC